MCVFVVQTGIFWGVRGMHENKEAFEDMTLECNKNIIEGEDYIAVTVLKSF